MSKLTDIETKIAQLLAKAESTDSPHEAEALSEAAMKLMSKHGIEMAMIDAARSGADKREEITEIKIEWLGSHAIEWLEFAWTLGAAVEGVYVLGTKTRDYVGTGKEKCIATVIGHESDVLQFQALFTSLQLQCLSAQKTWWKTYTGKQYMNGSQKWRERAAFTRNFAAGAASKIRVANREAVKEYGESTALVLVDRYNAVVDWANKKHSIGVSRRSRRQAGSWEAQMAGSAAGRAASTGGSSISSVKAIGG